MANRTRVRDADGISYLEVDVGNGQYAQAVVTVDTAGNLVTGTGTGAVTIAAGSDVTEGNTTDAAVVTNTTGTLSSKLRGLVALLRKGSGSAPAVVAVDTTATGVVLLATNANRLVAVFSNLDTTNAVYIGTTVALTALNGIKIPAGSSFQDERSTSAWRAICASGQTANVSVLEVS